MMNIERTETPFKPNQTTYVEKEYSSNKKEMPLSYGNELHKRSDSNLNMKNVFKSGKKTNEHTMTIEETTDESSTSSSTMFNNVKRNLMF
jgi:hypothetical protein